MNPIYLMSLFCLCVTGGGGEIESCEMGNQCVIALSPYIVLVTLYFSVS